MLEYIENPDKTDWLLSSIDGFFQTGFEQKRRLQHARYTDERFAVIINETLSLVTSQVQQSLDDFRHFQQSITPSAGVNWQADNSLDLNFQFVDTSSLEELSLTQTAEDALADLLSIKSVFGFFAKVALFFRIGFIIVDCYRQIYLKINMSNTKVTYPLKVEDDMRRWEY